MARIDYTDLTRTSTPTASSSENYWKQSLGATVQPEPSHAEAVANVINLDWNIKSAGRQKRVEYELHAELLAYPSDYAGLCGIPEPARRYGPGYGQAIQEYQTGKVMFSGYRSVAPAGAG